MSIFIIAEAGVNHNGSLKTAMELIDAAVAAKVDAVKFQTFKAEKITSKFAPKAEYQKSASGESQLELLRGLELDVTAHKKLMGHCKEKGIMFLSTPFDAESVELLDNLGMGIMKIPSGEITNLPYLQKIGALQKKVIMSTGMADLGDIEDALDVLNACGTPKHDIILLHCNTEYPTPFEDVNLEQHEPSDEVLSFASDGKLNLLVLAEATSNFQHQLFGSVALEMRLSAFRVLNNPPDDLLEKISVNVKVHPNSRDTGLFSLIGNGFEEKVMPTTTKLINALEESDIVIALNYRGSALIHTLRFGMPVIFFYNDKTYGNVEFGREAGFFVEGGIMVETSEEFWQVVRDFLTLPEFAEGMRTKACDFSEKYLDDAHYPTVAEVMRNVLP